MLFFLHLKRMRERKNTISILDEEISSLQDKKTSLGIEVAKKNTELEELKKQISDISEFVTLKEQTLSATQTLETLSGEIEAQAATLEKLKAECGLADECILLADLNQKLKKDLSDSIDTNLKKIFDNYPNVHAKKLNIKDFISFTSIDLPSVKGIIDSQLTKFALEHRIDPILYKELMYKFNSEWITKFNDFSKRYSSLNNTVIENFTLFKGFIVLVDKDSQRRSDK